MAEKSKKTTKKSSKVVSATSKTVARAHKAKESVAVVAVSKQASGFVEFLRNQGVVGLAVGLAIGTAAGATVKTIVEGFITPIVQFLVGTQENLESNIWHFELWGRSADFKWGSVVSSLITLIATAFVIYLIIHFAKLDRLDKKKDS
jgi:large conductance mechanosensitive channel protein